MTVKVFTEICFCEPTGIVWEMMYLGKRLLGKPGSWKFHILALVSMRHHFFLYLWYVTVESNWSPSFGFDLIRLLSLTGSGLRDRRD